MQWERTFECVFGNTQKPKEALVITNPAQISFDISKSVDQKKKANSASIELYNLSDVELAKLQSGSSSLGFSFKCGYEENGEGNKLLFLGSVTEYSTRKRGNDWVTQLVSGEGYKELTQETISKSFPPGTKLEDVVEAIRKEMPNISRGGFTGTNLSSPIPYGYQLKGTPQECLKKLADEFRLEYSVDRGSLNVGSEKAVSTKNYKKEAILLTEDTGLFDSPFYVTEDERKKDGDKKRRTGVQFKCTLIPELVPGRIVQLKSRLINGWYRVTHCRYSGDYRGDWLMECKADIIKEEDIPIA